MLLDSVTADGVRWECWHETFPRYSYNSLLFQNESIRSHASLPGKQSNQTTQTSRSSLGQSNIVLQNQFLLISVFLYNILKILLLFYLTWNLCLGINWFKTQATLLIQNLLQQILGSTLRRQCFSRLILRYNKQKIFVTVNYGILAIYSKEER